MNESVVPTVYVTQLQNVMKMDKMMKYDITKPMSAKDKKRRADIISAGVPGHPKASTQSSYDNVIKNVFLKYPGSMDIVFSSYRGGPNESCRFTKEALTCSEYAS